mgnify:CR=1 FL=1
MAQLFGSPAPRYFTYDGLVLSTPSMVIRFGALVSFQLTSTAVRDAWPGEHRDGKVARRLAEREARRRGERMDDDGPPEAALTDVSAHRLSIGLAAPP